MGPCIGVDGGASGVRALQVVVQGGVLFGRARCELQFDQRAAFRPADLDAQRGAHARSRIELGHDERAAGAERIWTCSEAIRRVAAELGDQPIALGLCMPGLKTHDGRGVAVLRNGPRMPAFLDDLERILAAHGVVLAGAVPALLGDGVAAALGERFAATGHLHGVEHALVLGGGTGLAESIVLRGRALALEEIDASAPKPWALEFEPGITYEDALSMGGWTRMIARSQARPSPERAEDAALQGDERALALLDRAARALASLCALRRDLVREHAGVELERAVVGQRLGQLLARADLRELLREPVDRDLAARGFPRSWLVVSTLRDAPALGAGASALGLPA